jgi:quercetin dioxygenase-like cupin family protein
VFEITIDGVTQRLEKGDSFYVPPNTLHGAVCLEEGELIDAFSPVRDEFID